MLERRLTQLWYDPAARGALLQPLAWLYGTVVQLRRQAYARGALSSRTAGRPVIVVGNLTVGGTGKTPFTIWLAQALRGLGLAPGIVSRGYARASARPAHEPLVVAAESSWRAVGDEPKLLQRRTGCPTVVARDRVSAARALAALGVDVIIADDGLQHLRLARDCSIVVIDGARGFGNGRLLPAGPLREPVSALAQADIVVVNGPAAHESLARAATPAVPNLQMTLRAEAACALPSGRAQPLEQFRGRPVHAVAGIGHPARFFRELRAHGLEVIEHPFPDHHAFTSAELEFGDGLPVLMTEKDAVRLGDRAWAGLWSVPVSAEFAPADARILLEAVLARVRAAAGGLPSAAAAG